MFQRMRVQQDNRLRERTIEIGRGQVVTSEELEGLLEEVLAKARTLQAGVGERAREVDRAGSFVTNHRAYVHAAAVLSWFDAGRIRPVAAAEDPAARDQLLFECVRIPDVGDRIRW